MNNLEIIKLILSERDFSKFVGLKEDLYFEVKSKNEYKLDLPANRYELAKDVTAFANSNGGHLIVGMYTERLLDENTDKVNKLDLFAKDLEYLEKLRGIIKEYTHPKIIDMKIDWIEDGNTGLGAICIYVPIQDEGRKFFLVKNIVDGDNKISEMVCSIVKRIDSSNSPFTPNQVYDAIQKGKHPMAERLTRMEDKIDSLLERGKPAPHLTRMKYLDEKIKGILQK